VWVKIIGRNPRRKSEEENFKKAFLKEDEAGKNNIFTSPTLGHFQISAGNSSEDARSVDARLTQSNHRLPSQRKYVNFS
jgi:hypothetical protein